MLTHQTYRFWRATILPIVLMANLLLNPFLADTTWAAEPLKGNRLTGKVITSNGKPVAGAQVQLLDPKKTMMDVTLSAADGRFNIDLGVLESEEMAKLRQFTLQIIVNGKKQSQRLEQATSTGGIVQVAPIELR